ncbi:hypothetical protein [Clostridium beijerinckii]|uniref:hypothetical protein n=1 Tax=Clostridium beijerinckii TaxID=1520 RepID=UPI001F4C010A|nr:hypothetical protein [Clostridium beijerinckii]NRX82460.1 hypothetical protein [Clostridium beijerinckii]
MWQLVTKNILIIFYSVYRNIEGEKYHQNSFFDEDNSDKLEIRTIDSLVSYYLNKYVKNNNINLTLASFEECEAELKDAIRIVSKRYGKKKAGYIKFRLY